MGQYKDMEIPDSLDDVIAYMDDVDSYREELTILGQAWDLLTILGQMTGGRTDMTTTREAFRVLTEHLLSSLGEETLTKVVQDIAARSQVTVDIIIRNLFERTADIGFLATDDDIRDFIRAHQDQQSRFELADEDEKSSILDQKTINQEKMIARFQEYVAKYSVYHNIMLLDTEGNVLVQMDPSNPVTHSEDPLLNESLKTQEDYVETYRNTDLLPDEEKSLVYSFRVTETNDVGSAPLGVLCLCFRFENELEGIFNNLSTENDWSVLTLLDKDGCVIASSSGYQVPVGAQMELALDEDYKIVKFAGRRYVAKTVKTNGYQDFYGLGWYGHAMLPLDVAFDVEKSEAMKKVDAEILNSVMNNPELFSKEIQRIPLDAEKIQGDLDRTVWNGNILPEDSGDSASSSASKVLLWEISKTGMKTKNVFGRSIENLHETVVSTFMSDVEFMADLAIDIMDRNLYERANDCRWWALTTQFRRLLAQATLDQSDASQIKNTLEYINNLYTVYTNLFVYDKSGKIIAVSNPEEEHLVGQVLKASWVSQALNIKDSQVYSVSPFMQTELYSDQYTYVYNAAITDLENSHRVLGGIGIVFDSTPEFRAMLTDTLPRNTEGELIAGCFSLFTDREGRIISSSNDQFSPGDELELDPGLFKLEAGDSTSKILEFNDHYYAIGIKSSNGYREYKSEQDTYENEVLCFVFMELDRVRSADEIHQPQQNTRVQSNSSHPAPTSDYVEIATFYIGDDWFGIKTENVVEAIELTQLSVIPSAPAAVMGTLFFHNEAIVILNPGDALGAQPDVDSENNQVIVMKTERGYAGILVDSLGEIPKVEEQMLQKERSSLLDAGSFIDCLVTPNSGDDSSPMLIVLNPTELHKHITGDFSPPAPEATEEPEALVV